MRPVHVTAEGILGLKLLFARWAVELWSPHMLVLKVSADVILGLEHKAAQHAQLAATLCLLYMFSKQHMDVLHFIQEI